MSGDTSAQKLSPVRLSSQKLSITHFQTPQPKFAINSNNIFYIHKSLSQFYLLLNGMCFRFLGQIKSSM